MGYTPIRLATAITSTGNSTTLNMLAPTSQSQYRPGVPNYITVQVNVNGTLATASSFGGSLMGSLDGSKYVELGNITFTDAHKTAGVGSFSVINKHYPSLMWTTTNAAPSSGANWDVLLLVD